MKFTLGFQNRLLITYSISILLLVLVLGFSFYHYSVGIFENSSKETNDLLVVKMGGQLDTLFKPMDFISTNLISDESFKTALLVLDTIDRDNNENARFISEAEQTIRKQLYTYSIIKNFYALTVFNRKDDFYTSNFLEHSDINTAGGLFHTLPWMDSAIDANGKLVTVPIGIDPFDDDSTTEIFGRARIVPGANHGIGCVSVYYKKSMLDALFLTPQSEDLSIYAFLPSGETLYNGPQVDDENLMYYSNFINNDQRDSSKPFSENPHTGAKEYISTHTSPSTGVSIVLVLNRNVLLAPLAFSRSLTIGIGALLILFSLVYNLIASRLLTKPLRIIQNKIEETEFSNLENADFLEHENDEIVALDRAFVRLKERLLESLKREVDSRGLWLKARLDSLQSQVNPHFINNVLTVIAGKALEIGNNDICEMCDGVSSMLRYSTETTHPWTTVREEIDHLTTYLYLMKQRLENQFIYSIDIDQRILDVELPKIIFQQIAENSIAHGFNSRVGIMKIDVVGTLADKYWHVEITDNGDGFDDESLLNLQGQIEEIHNNPDRSVLEKGLKLGGMGLINVYARLFLFYKEDILWNIENIEPHGARVLLGGPIMENEAGERNNH